MAFPKALKKIKLLYFMILGSFMTLSCIDPIDFDIDNNNQYLVVDGFITDQCNPHTIRLTMSANYEADVSETAVTGALVYVRDVEGNVFRFEEEPALSGFYVVENDFQGTPGMSYTLQIETAEGNRYSSKPELLRSSTEIDDLYWEFTSKQKINEYSVTTEVEGIQYYLDFNFPDNNESYYMWQWEETFIFRTHFHTIEVPLNCYVTEQSGNFISIMTNRNLTTNSVTKREFLFNEVDFRYYLRHSLNVKQYAISSGAYNFYQQIENQINNSGTIFDTTPTKINGNMYNVDNPDEVVLGYFGAFGETEKRTFVDAYILPVDFEEEVIFNRGNYARCALAHDPPPYCYDCRLFINSTSELPDFW